jgi:hypothetical protein
MNALVRQLLEQALSADRRTQAAADRLLAIADADRIWNASSRLMERGAAGYLRDDEAEALRAQIRDALPYGSD